MDITSFILGMKKGAASAKVETQEKTVEITENGTTEVLPDAGYALAKVIANVNVAGSGGGDVKYFYGSVKIPSGIGRVSVNFGFAPDFLLLFPGDNVSVADTISMLFVGTSSKFAEIFGRGGSQNSAYVSSNKITRQNCGSGIDMVITETTSQKIHTANATGFTLGTKLSAGTWYAYAFGF